MTRFSQKILFHSDCHYMTDCSWSKDSKQFLIEERTCRWKKLTEGRKRWTMLLWRTCRSLVYLVRRKGWSLIYNSWKSLSVSKKHPGWKKETTCEAEEKREGVLGQRGAEPIFQRIPGCWAKEDTGTSCKTESNSHVVLAPDRKQDKMGAHQQKSTSKVRGPNALYIWYYLKLHE